MAGKFEAAKNDAKEYFKNIPGRVWNRGERTLGLFQRKVLDAPGFLIGKLRNTWHINKQEKILGKIEGRINGAHMSITARRRALEIETNMYNKMKSKAAGDQARIDEIDDMIREKRAACDADIKRIQTDQIEALKLQRQNQINRRQDFVNERNRLINEMNGKVQGDIDRLETKLGLSAVKQSELELRKTLEEKKKDTNERRKEYNEIKADIEELKAMGADVSGMKGPLKLAWQQLKSAENDRAIAERKWNKAYLRIADIDKKTQGWYNLKDALGLVNITVSESAGARAAKEAREAQATEKKSDAEQLADFKKITQISEFIDSKGILYKEEIAPADKTALKDKIKDMGFTKIAPSDIDDEIDAKILARRNKIKAENEKNVALYTDDEKVAHFKNNPIKKQVLRRYLEANGWLVNTKANATDLEELGYKLTDPNKWDELKDDIAEVKNDKNKKDIANMSEANQLNHLKTKNKKLLTDYLKDSGFFIPDNDADLARLLVDNGYSKLDQAKIFTLIIDNSKDLISKMDEAAQVKAINSPGGYLDRLRQSGGLRFSNIAKFNANNGWGAIQTKIKSLGFDGVAPNNITPAKWTEIKRRAQELAGL